MSDQDWPAKTVLGCLYYGLLGVMVSAVIVGILMALAWR